MSVTGSYWRLNADEWAQLEPYLTAKPGTDFYREGEQAFVGLISPEWMETDRYLDLQKEWHLLHCLLTGRYEPPGEITPAPPPMGNAVRGGTPTPFEAHDGMTRYLLPPEVREVASALSQVSVDEIVAGIDIDLVRRSDVYSWGPDSELWQVEAVVREELPRLISFFEAASREDQVVVLALD